MLINLDLYQHSGSKQFRYVPLLFMEFSHLVSSFPKCDQMPFMLCRKTLEQFFVSVSSQFVHCLWRKYEISIHPDGDHKYAPDCCEQLHETIEHINIGENGMVYTKQLQGHNGNVSNLSRIGWLYFLDDNYFLEPISV